MSIHPMTKVTGVLDISNKNQYPELKVLSKMYKVFAYSILYKLKVNKMSPSRIFLSKGCIGVTQFIPDSKQLMLHPE